jgi:hypothetical protein
MPKTIIDLVNEKSDRLGRLKPNAANPPANAEEKAALQKEAEDLAKLSVRAITEGRFSFAWREYMLQFVDKDPVVNANQLARLLAQDDSIDDEMMNRRRAYMLGNAVCGAPTTGRPDVMFDNGVDTIDDGL